MNGLAYVHTKSNREKTVWGRGRKAVSLQLS